MTTKLLLLACVLTLQGCAANETIPVAANCPPPPPVPAVLTSSVSSGPSISERMENLLRDYEQARAALLTKAQRQP